MPVQVTIDPREGGKPGTVWFPLVYSDVSIPKATEGKSVVKTIAAALNHRDVFQRQNSYPNLGLENIIGSDGVGVVVDGTLKGERVLFQPGKGWESDTHGPEGPYGILGGQNGMSGTFAEYVLFDEHELFKCPSHLTNSEAAALPLAGLTAWRALFTKGQCKSGMNILITGIGGGVALFALQFAVAAGVSVWVTSGSDEKIERAKKLGAKGGINYKTEKWGKVLAKQLPEKLDLVIDSAGGNIITDVLPCLKVGRPIVAYGMTIAPKVTFSMAAVLANVEFRGSTMGSRAEFKQMLKFVEEQQLRPVVHKVYQKITDAEDAMIEMRDGKQFGKIVVMIDPEASPSGNELVTKAVSNL